MFPATYQNTQYGVTENKESVPLPPDYQVLQHAISSCAVPAIQQLLSGNPNLVHIKGWHGQSPLHKACLGGDWNVNFVLLQAGADANIRNDFDETPVHYACKRGVSSLAHLLLQYGGDFSVVDKQGRDVVHHAAQTGSVYMLHYLASRGISLQERDKNHITPLHLVCQFGHVDAVRYLLGKQRCDTSVVDREGNTALHITAREGYSYISWLLLVHGGCAQLHNLNNAGFTPVNLAEQRDTIGHRLIAPVLKQYSKYKDHSHKPRGPLLYWYWSLLMPVFTYSLAIVLAKMWGNSHQGLVFFIWFACLSWDLIKKRQHRFKHVCRWPDPVYAGLFGAGLFHSLIIYFAVVLPQISHHILLICLSLLGMGTLLPFYWKVLTQPPGEAKQSIVDKQTGLPLTLVDLCHPQAKVDSFCIGCEIVRGERTKHCKLCDKCFIEMDHHCLFLMRCIAYKNHHTFVWFCAVVVLSIAQFLCNVVVYCLTLYDGRSFTEMLVEIYHHDAWVLSMFLMNAVSLLWGINLLKYQLNLVSKGQTTIFQSKQTVLTSTERILNIFHFLSGNKPVKDPLLCV